jgi:hypothetical protein
MPEEEYESVDPLRLSWRRKTILDVYMPTDLTPEQTVWLEQALMQVAEQMRVTFADEVYESSGVMKHMEPHTNSAHPQTNLYRLAWARKRELDE